MQPLNEASRFYLEPWEAHPDSILSIGLTPNGEKFFIEVYSECTDSEGRKNYTSPISYKDGNFVSRRFKHGYKSVTRRDASYPQYEVAITDYSVQVLQCWKGNRVIRDNAKNHFSKIFLRELAAELNASRAAKFRSDKTIPTSEWFDSHDTFLSERGITLSPYQKVAAFNACNSGSYALFCDPGTGKTAMMIRKLDYVIEHSSGQCLTLILCPKAVRTNWRNELKKFSRQYPNCAILTLDGGNSSVRTANFIQQYAANASKHIILICGYENFVTTPEIHPLAWSLVALDESHNIANPSTRRTKTLVEFVAKVPNKIIATGTPFRNSPFDIFSQFEFMGKGYSGFDSFHAFKAFFGEYGAPNAYNGQQKLIGFNHIPLLQERMAKHAFVIRKEEALPYLPKKSFSIKTCEMSTSQKKTYRQLCEMLIAEIESYGPSPDSITVNNILTQMLRLAQITSGYVPTDAGELNRFNDNPKLDLLVSHLLGSSSEDEEEGSEGVLSDPNRKAIVWVAFKENVKMITSRLALEGIKCVTFDGSSKEEQRDEAVAAFNNDPSVRCFVGIAASGGVGLNLVGFDSTRPDEYTTNATDVIFYSSNWSSIHRLQAQDRAHRHNTRVPVHVVDLLCDNSIDEEIYSRVEGKIEMSLSLQDLKQILLTLSK